MRRHLLHHTPKKRSFDRGLFITVCILTLFGLIMVYDSSTVQAFQDFGDKYFYIKQQLIWVVLGFGALGFFSILDYHHLHKIALPFFAFALLLLLAVYVPGLGVAAGGAQRWLKVGFFTLQPTEIIKLASVIFFAVIFAKGKSTGLFLSLLGLITFIIGFLQKDLGSAIVFCLTSVVTFILAGAPLSYFLAAIPLGVVGSLGLVLSSTYRKQRILAFLNPFADPTGYSYHISQVLIALGSGNWFGLGLGQSRQKFEYIPETTTDSMFAIVGEEYGFFGSVLLIGLITFVIYKGLEISENATDDFGRFLWYGLTLWLGIQAALNLAAMVALVPLTGVPLPFISYGGSALLANLVAVGILLNISKSSRI